jgi:hypothetical protein
METITGDRWLSRRELADRYSLPVKIPAEWATKGTGPPCAKFGRHVRCRLSDVIASKKARFADHRRRAALAYFVDRTRGITHDTRFASKVLVKRGAPTEYVSRHWVILRVVQCWRSLH